MNKRVSAPTSLQTSLVIFGSQGSGKTTQAKILAEHFHTPLFLAGERLRLRAQTNPEIASTLALGHLVPDEIFLDEVKIFLQEISSDQPIIFEGVARNPSQQKLFTDLLASQNRSFQVILINLPESIAKERLTLRRQNREQNRDDEADAILQNRLHIWQTQTLPSIANFRSQGHSVIEIDGSPSPSKVTSQILAALSLQPS